MQTIRLRFFSKSSSDTSKISYYEIIKEIRTLRLATDDEILRLIIENIDNIIIDSGTSFPGVMEHISHLLNIASDEQIDIIMQKYIEGRNGTKTRKDNWYNFHWFDKMEKFKQEIKNLGVEFFVNFPINNTIEEYKKISEELFGIYDEKILSILEFGQYDKTKALLMETIIKEFMQHSKEECTVDDIKMIGMGNFSSVYKVKDYVLKVGYLRHDNNIPNHRRILQPIIRRKYENEPQTLEKYKHKKYFVEVQNLVDMDCWEDMNTEQIDEILFKIYCDLRNNGIVWTDIIPANAGKLLKDNNINYTYTDIDSVQKNIRPTREATGMDRELSQREILKKGDYVVIDTDYLEKYNEKKMKERQYTGGRIYMTYMFEDKYQK